MPFETSGRDLWRETWFTFHQTIDSTMKCEEDVFAKLDLPFQQFNVMGALQYLSAPVTPTNVANRLDRNPNSITLLLDQLEEDGLIERVRDLKDRRKLRLVTTAKGKEKYKKVFEATQNLPQELLSGFSPEELNTFMTLLKRIREATFVYRDIKDETENMTRPDDITG